MGAELPGGNTLEGGGIFGEEILVSGKGSLEEIGRGVNFYQVEVSDNRINFHLLENMLS